MPVTLRVLTDKGGLELEDRFPPGPRDVRVLKSTA
jgi:hypothetical protein